MAYKDKAQKTAHQNDYISKAYDRVNLLVGKGDKEQIKQAAAANGESVNAYILEAVQQRMTADGSSTDNDGKL
jgi:predicted HicB family RNase H-like nuclease